MPSNNCLDVSHLNKYITKVNNINTPEPWMLKKTVFAFWNRSISFCEWNCIEKLYMSVKAVSLTCSKVENSGGSFPFLRSLVPTEILATPWSGWCRNFPRPFLNWLRDCQSGMSSPLVPAQTRRSQGWREKPKPFPKPFVSLSLFPF